MDEQQQQFETQLAVKKTGKKLRPLNGPGVVWLLVVLVLMLLALSVNLFEKPQQTKTANISVSATPSPTETLQSRVYAISYKNGVFSPTNLRIHAGDTVRFKNDGIFPIRVVSDAQPTNEGAAGFDSIGDIPQGSYFAFTFAARGIFGYHNYKNAGEAGTVIVR